jgi:cytochrome c-type biogenesis protein CcmE
VVALLVAVAAVVALQVTVVVVAVHQTEATVRMPLSRAKSKISTTVGTSAATRFRLGAGMTSHPLLRTRLGRGC